MELVSTVLFLLVLSSGSIFASAYFDKKYEEVLPITCVAIVAISFLLGMIKLLGISSIVIILISIALYVLAIRKTINENKVSKLLKNTFTPGFVVFMVLSLMFFVALKGKLLDSFDEFSHWGDVVKAMMQINDFASNKLSRSIFKTYPPGMSLFQFFFEKLNSIITGESFSEWMLYYSYYLFEFALIVPICKDFSFKRITPLITLILTTILVPYTFYTNAYTAIYIDPFLSFLLCAGAIELLWHNECDLWFDIRVCSIMFMLVLAKDAGIIFALLIGIAYVIEHILDNNEKITSKKNLIIIASALLSILIPKLLWSLSCMINNAHGLFEAKIDFISLINVLLGKEDSYRITVLKKYIEIFLTGGLIIGRAGIEIVYIVLTMFSLTGIYIAVNQAVRKNLIKESYAYSSMTMLMSSMIIFIIGMVIIYMYKFSEPEAIGLASMWRYLCIVYLAAWLFINVSLIRTFDEIIDKTKTVCLLLICLMFISAPLEIIVPYFTRANVKASINIRSEYQELINKTNEIVEPGSTVWYVSQNTDGLDRLIYKFSIRPSYQRNSQWVIGKPRYEGDSLSLDISAKEWMEDLKDNYDYVAIYTLNDAFSDNFSEVFKNYKEIGENRIYKVDKDSGKLSLCE